MSSPQIMPGAKAENAVYLAFGLILSLAIIKVLVPEFYSIAYTRELVAAAALGASLIGAIVFYSNLDDIIPYVLKRRVRRRYGENVAKDTALIRMYFQVWHVATREGWPTVVGEANNSISSTVDSVDMYDDIWRLKGAFYFIFSVTTLGLTVNLPLSFEFLGINTINLFVFGGIILVILLSALVSTKELQERISIIARTRIIQDTRSIAKSRVDFGAAGSSPVLDSLKPTIPGNLGTLNLILSELEGIIRSRDWPRLKRRYEHLVESLNGWIGSRTLPMSYEESTKRYFEETIATLYATWGTEDYSDYRKQKMYLNNLFKIVNSENQDTFNRVCDYITHVHYLERDSWRSYLQGLLTKRLCKIIPEHGIDKSVSTRAFADILLSHDEEVKKKLLEFNPFFGKIINGSAPLDIIESWCREDVEGACECNLVLSLRMQIQDIQSKFALAIGHLKGIASVVASEEVLRAMILYHEQIEHIWKTNTDLRTALLMIQNHEKLILLLQEKIVRNQFVVLVKAICHSEEALRFKNMIDFTILNNDQVPRRIRYILRWKLRNIEWDDQLLSMQKAM